MLEKTSIHKIAIVVKGKGNWKITNPMKGISSVTFEVKLYPVTFFRLSKIILPRFIPFTIFAKLSSKSEISAASFATTVPTFP
jgi:hypothetical protein